MGIQNIQVLINPDIRINEPNMQAQALAAYQQALIEAHRRGEHPYGSMRRDCPLCQVS